MNSASVRGWQGQRITMVRDGTTEEANDDADSDMAGRRHGRTRTWLDSDKDMVGKGHGWTATRTWLDSDMVGQRWLDKDVVGQRHGRTRTR